VSMNAKRDEGAFLSMSGVGRVAPAASSRPDTPRPSAAICFSHLRWDFVYQRPQHLMTRLARDHRVYYFEEPLPAGRPEPWLERRQVQPGVEVVVPRLPEGGEHDRAAQQRALLDALVAGEGLDGAVLWYYTPMALAFSAHLRAPLVVYDCMDELSAFKN